MSEKSFSAPQTKPDAPQVSSQFVRFLLVGGVAAAVNFLSRIALSHWLTFAPAIVLAYLLGLITAFLLNRRYVFPTAANRVRQQILWFVMINLFAVAQTLLVSILFADYVLPYLGIVRHAQEFAHAAGIITPVFSSYLGHKHLSFSTRC